MEPFSTGGTLMTEVDVSRRLRISIATVRRWRLLGGGPTYLKIGASVRYRPEDLSKWVESRPTGGKAPSERGNGHEGR